MGGVGGGSGNASTPVRAWLRDYAVSWRRRDVSRLEELYAQDAALIGSCAEAAFGRDAIRRLLQEEMSGGPGDVRFDVVHEWGSGTLACAVGRYSLSFGPGAHGPAAPRGSFVLVLGRREDGTWEACADAFVRDPAARDWRGRPGSSRLA